jgi:hypothetical protein
MHGVRQPRGIFTDTFRILREATRTLSSISVSAGFAFGLFVRLFWLLLLTLSAHTSAWLDTLFVLFLFF